MAGKKTDIANQESKGFVYVFRPNECSSFEFHELIDLPQGVREIVKTDFYVHLLGYHTEESGTRWEVIL